MGLFGKRKTPKEILRENKRMLDKSIRELDRERSQLQSQEKNLVGEIKQMAKKGQMNAVKVMAKDLVRTQQSITKFYQLKSQLQGVSLRIQTMKSTQAMGEAMKGVTKAMTTMNKQLNLPALQNILRDFEMQNEKMEITQEALDDSVDDILEGENEEEETEKLVSQSKSMSMGVPTTTQVLDDIGVNLNAELGIAPTGTGGTKEAEAPAEENPINADLQARLDNLRRM